MKWIVLYLLTLYNIISFKKYTLGRKFSIKRNYSEIFESIETFDL